MLRGTQFLALALAPAALLATVQDPTGGPQDPPAPPSQSAAHPQESAPATPAKEETPAKEQTPPAVAQQTSIEASPAFTSVPELCAGFDLLYEQKFTEARKVFNDWESHNRSEPFGEVALAASYLFEELYRQGVLSSDFFLNEKKFLHGIDGKPDPERISQFREALAKARRLARERLQSNPHDGEALFALTLTAGMESDELSILEKKHLEGLKRMREANDYAKQLLALHPDAADAYIAPGIANYIIGSLNPGFRLALWFGGIHGDKKLGMRQVANTAENGRYLRPFAKIMLALAARREKQTTLAQRLLRELSQQYPDNELFASEYAKAMGLPIPAVLVR